MDNIIQKAIIKALALHEGQERKGDGGPYIVHPLETAFIVSRYTSDDTLIAAAVLHDTVEDTPYTLEKLTEEFGQQVAALVSALTQKKEITDWAERRRENIERIKQTQHAPFIKAADCLSNMRSLVFALKRDGTPVWGRFNATKPLYLAYFRAVLSAARNIMPQEMVERYVEALKDIEYSEIFETRAIGFANASNAA